MDDVKIAVLEQKLEDVNSVVLRIDAAIEKLSEVNTTVSRISLFMKKITKQERLTSYYLKLTNSVIKWTGIMTLYCQEYLD